jgi:hypothetical protein
MNILPLLYQDFLKTGEKSSLMVAGEFSPLLEGVSYVTPIVHPGPHYEIDIAAAKAREIAPAAIVTQVNGPPIAVKQQTYEKAGQDRARTTSFQKESWKVAGRLGQWDECLPLVFDQRDKAREQKLMDSCGVIPKRRGEKKPLILLALNSNSSPFPYIELLRFVLDKAFGVEYRLLDLPKAERLYDLLALYERAALLVAVDSAPLHLAWACRPLPVFAMAQDRPTLWHGASWRPNHLWYCRYHDWPKRAVEMMDAIACLASPSAQTDFVTVWNAYQDKGHYPAWPSVLPAAVGSCGRDTWTMFQEPRRAPFLRDVIRMAMQRAGSDASQIHLTRSHVSVQPPDLAPPYFAYRMLKTADGLQFSPVADLFCATKAWWREVLPEIPDFVLGNDHLWSEGLRVLFQQRGAKNATGCCSFVKEK